jgi:hypothetical protein
MKLQRRNKGFCGECKVENFCREMGKGFSKPSHPTLSRWWRVLIKGKDLTAPLTFVLSRKGREEMK